MKKKFAKLLMAMLCLSLCLAMLASCDLTDLNPLKAGQENAEKEGSEPENSETDVEAMAKAEWNEKVAEKNFENYTVSMEGRMTVTQAGLYETTADMSQIIKVTSDKISITILSDVAGDSDEYTQVYEGEIAEVTKTQNAQLFLTIIRDYENFVYDKETKTYKIPEPVVFEEVLKGIEGQELFDVPTRIEVREASVTFTKDGLLATLVSDYSQTMELAGQTVTTSGKVTWTFSNFGTTVIE